MGQAKIKELEEQLVEYEEEHMRLQNKMYEQKKEHERSKGAAGKKMGSNDDLEDSLN